MRLKTTASYKLLLTKVRNVSYISNYTDIRKYLSTVNIWIALKNHCIAQITACKSLQCILCNQIQIYASILVLLIFGLRLKTTASYKLLLAKVCNVSYVSNYTDIRKYNFCLNTAL